MSDDDIPATCARLCNANERLLSVLGSADDTTARNECVSAFETLIRALNQLREPQSKSGALKAATLDVDKLIASLERPLAK
jgi:hypothetical protein